MKPEILYVLLLLSILSCQKEFEVPDTGRKLVINGLITTNNTLGISITKSLYISDSTMLGTDTISNAQVYLYENSNFVDSLINVSNWPVWPVYMSYLQIPVNYKISNFKPSAGNFYQVYVKAQGFPDAYATTRIPNIVEIEHLDTSIVKITGNLEEWQENIRLFFRKFSYIFLGVKSIVLINLSLL